MTTNQLHEILKKKKATPKELLSREYWHVHHHYIAQSYLFDNNLKTIEYKRRFYNHLKSAERFVFLERLKGRQADLYDNHEKRFI